jgi:CheY-like chemotaxis protein
MDNMTSSSSSQAKAEELRADASKMIAEANREIRNLFRTTRKVQLVNRGGVILLVDDVPQQKSVIDQMVERYSLRMDVENVPTAAAAREFVSNRAEDVRLIVIDIMLLGSAALPDGSLTEDGLSLVDWLKKFHPEIPFVITTGHAERADEATSRFPGVDVLLKGQTDIEEYADAIGLVDYSEERASGQVIPVDA